MKKTMWQFNKIIVLRLSLQLKLPKATHTKLYRDGGWSLCWVQLVPLWGFFFGGGGVEGGIGVWDQFRWGRGRCLLPVYKSVFARILLFLFCFVSSYDNIVLFSPWLFCLRIPSYYLSTHPKERDQETSHLLSGQPGWQDKTLVRICHLMNTAPQDAFFVDVGAYVGEEVSSKKVL